jgi:hypothetical protein
MQAILIIARDAGDTIPQGFHGGRLVVQYRLMKGTEAAANATITERFTAVEDPNSIVPQIQKGSYTTDRTGRFDDSVGFWTRTDLPADFRLVADQEIYADGSIAARNRVIWTNNSILVTATDGRRPRTVAAQVRLR